MGRFLMIFPFLILLIGGQILNPTHLLYTFLIFLGLIFVSTPFLRAIFFPRLKAEITVPVRAAVNSVASGEVLLENNSRRNAYYALVRYDELPDPLVPAQEQGKLIPFLKTGEKTRVVLDLKLEKRGHHTLKAVRIETPFPWGVIKSGYLQKFERHILVYPDFSRLIRCEIPAGRKLQPGGIALASHVGESTEFLSTREFREGDDPRYIHWKSWAKLGKPIVKEFQEEFFTRIAIFIDTYVPHEAGEEKYQAFESLLSVAASISDYLQRQEYVIDIIAAGPEVFYLQAGRSLAYLDQILDILAVMDVCREKPYSKTTPMLMDQVRSISTVVALLLDWDEDRKKFLLEMKDMGVQTRTYLVNNDPVFESSKISDMEDSLGEVIILNSDEVREGLTSL